MILNFFNFEPKNEKKYQFLQNVPIIDETA